MSLTGLTLFEIVVATILLSIIMTGLMSVVVAGKRYILHSRSRMTSAELGKLFLDPLQMYVRQNTWDESTNALSEGTTYCDGVNGHTQNPSCPSLDGRTIDNIVYAAKYEISSDLDLVPNLRKVKTTIQWTESSP